MKIAYNPTGGSALSKSQIDSLKNDIIFDLSGMAVYARGIPVGKVYLPFEKSTSSTTEGYNGLVPFPDYNGNSKTRFLREDGTWVVPTNTNNYRPISVNGASILGNNNTALNLVAGTNITLNPKKDSNNKYTGEVTITANAIGIKDLSGTSFSTYLKSSITYGYNSDETKKDNIVGDFGIFNMQTSSYTESNHFYFRQFRGQAGIDKLYTRLYYKRENEDIKYTDWKEILKLGDYTTLAGYGITDAVKLASFGQNGIDLNELDETGIWNGLQPINRPTGAYGYSSILNSAYQPDYQTQLYFDHHLGNVLKRNNKAGTWQEWNMLLDTANASSHVVDLTSDQTISGKKTFSNFKVSNTNLVTNLNAEMVGGLRAANFARAIHLNQGEVIPRNIYSVGYIVGTGVDGETPLGDGGGYLASVRKDGYGGHLFISNSGSVFSRGVKNSDVSSWKELAFTDSNVASATKLETPRTIWGQRFDGTNNVRGALYLGANSIVGSDNLIILSHLASGYLDIGYGNATAGYSTYINGNSIHFRYSTEHKTGILISSNGNVAIGAVSPTEKLEVSGNIKATSFLGNLDGSYINKLTGYTKATAISAIAATDTLNTALGKLELKADTAYNWYKSVTGTDNDDIINKWEEIVDFIDSIKEGTDITEEFVTRKTELTIIGAKTFSGSTATILTVDRDNDNPTLITFKNKGVLKGYLGIDSSEKPVYTNSSANTSYILHSGNTYINNGTITINDNTITPLTTGYIGTTQILTTSKIQALTGITSLNMSENINILSGNSDRYITFGYSNNAFTSADAYSWRLGYIGSGENNSNYFKIQSSHGNTWTDVLKLGLLTYEATFSGNVIASGNVTASGDLIIKNSGINAATPYLKFQRGSINDSYIDWRLGSTNNGKLILQYNINESNATTETWNDVFVTTRTVSTFNSALEVAGSLLTLGNSNGSTLLFKRPSASYIWADEPGGYFVIGVKDAGTTSTDNASLLITKEFIQPGRRNNAVYLGNSSYRWANIFSVLGNFGGNVTAAGFVKSGSTDSHVLLGAGGHKALSDFLLETEFASKELGSNLTTITKTLVVSKDWVDTGIVFDTATFPNGTGSYIVQLSRDDLYYWTGCLSIVISNNVTAADSDEILLHGGGFDTGIQYYLRTVHDTTNKVVKLQIARNNTYSTSKIYTFKFKKLI